jgi:hypothetical protein
MSPSAQPSSELQDPPLVADATVEAARAVLIEAHGEAEASRIDRGLEQVREMWRPMDGDDSDYRAFVESEFLPTGEMLDQTFARFEFAMERIGGYMNSLARDLQRGVHLDSRNRDRQGCRQIIDFCKRRVPWNEGRLEHTQNDPIALSHIQLMGEGH